MPDPSKRTMLKAIGAGAALSLLGGTAAAQQRDPQGGDCGRRGRGRGEECPRTKCIHPELGYVVLPDEEVPRPMQPDDTVALRIGPLTRTVGPPEPELDFFYDPVGLQVGVGDVIGFDAQTPDHTVTAYHAAQGRDQRVPSSLPPFSSPVLAPARQWLYRFDEPGVYDLVCAPHEAFGMAMRVVVGTQTSPIVRQAGRPPLPAASAVLGDPALDPSNVVSQGSIAWSDLGVTSGGT